MTDANDDEHSEQPDGSEPATFSWLVTELRFHERQVMSVKQKLVDCLNEDLKATVFEQVAVEPELEVEAVKVLNAITSKAKKKTDWSGAKGSGTTIEDKPKAKRKAKRKSRPSGIQKVKEGSRSHEILLAMERVGSDCKATDVLEHTNGLAETANGLSSVRNYLLQLAKGDEPWVERVELGTYRMTARATDLLANLAPATP